MIRRISFLVFLLVVVSGSIWLFTLRAPQPEKDSTKIHIIASVYPLAHIASMVGGELVDVRTLVPAGAEPHDFEPSSRDFIDIQKAELFLYNGAGFEPWIGKWEMSSPIRNAHSIDMARELAGKGVPLISRDGGIDPHFWIDPVIYAREVEVVRDALSFLDPTHQEMFKQRANWFIGALGALDERFKKELIACKVRDIVVSHDAFSYLAERYGILVTSIAGISPDEEPAPKDLARITTLAREKKINYIFSETVASPKFSEALAREINGQTLVLNPIESLTPSEVQSGEDYVSKMEANLNNLKIAMSCQ